MAGASAEPLSECVLGLAEWVHQVSCCCCCCCCCFVLVLMLLLPLLLPVLLLLLPRPLGLHIY